MNREDSRAIVDGDEGIDVAGRENHPAQRRAAGICNKPGGQHEAEAAPRARQRGRAFDEKLIPVRMAGGLRRIDAGVACKADDGGDRCSGFVASIGWAVGAHHVPRWVADDGIESRPRQALSVLVEKSFRKLQLPMKESICRRDRIDRIQILVGDMRRKRAGLAEHAVGERLEGGRGWTAEPGRTPRVGDALPARERVVPRRQCLERPLLSAHLLERVVRRRLEREPDRHAVAQRPGRRFMVKQRQRRHGRSPAEVWPSSKSFHPGAEQAVACQQSMIEERQRPVRRERGEPQG